MSCSLWMWSEACDGRDDCPGDCDLCNHWPEDESEG